MEVRYLSVLCYPIQNFPLPVKAINVTQKEYIKFVGGVAIRLLKTIHRPDDHWTKNLKGQRYPQK